MGPLHEKVKEKIPLYRKYMPQEGASELRVM